MAAYFWFWTLLVVDRILWYENVWFHGKGSCLGWGCGKGWGLINTAATTTTTVFCCSDTVVAVVWPDDVFSSTCRRREKKEHGSHQTSGSCSFPFVDTSSLPHHAGTHHPCYLPPTHHHLRTHTPSYYVQVHSDACVFMISQSHAHCLGISEVLVKRALAELRCWD